jgi:hypothetical protein
MSLFGILRGVCVSAAVLVMVGCAASTTKPDALFKTYASAYIHANWGLGAAGEPIDRKNFPAGSFTGSICPTDSLIMDNHGTRYVTFFSNSRNGLVFKNTCNANADLLVCVSSGSGGNFSEFPVCNQDPSTTPLSRLASVNLGPNNSGLQSVTYRDAGLSLDINVFFCGVGDAFAAGLISGAKPTDCLQH